MRIKLLVTKFFGMSLLKTQKVTFLKYEKKN